MNDLMIDIETMGTGHNAVMIQLGAVWFDRKTGELGKSFCRSISEADACRLGFKTDPQTKKWWSFQNQDVLKDIQDNEEPVEVVLKDFVEFLGDTKGVQIWSHATFDFVIVNNYLKTLKLKPMFYRAARDIRTLVDLADIDLTAYNWEDGKTHNALDDCRFQVKYCVDALNKVNSDDS